MKIYTKTGDGGQTSLLGGKRVSKAHAQLEAYGTVDELNAHIGYLASMALKKKRKKILIASQKMLFVIGAHLSLDPEKKGIKLPRLEEEEILQLEIAIDAIEERLPPLTSFILPGGGKVIAYCHIVRTVCRRAERRVVELQENDFPVSGIIIQYLNRLSDFLFVLAREIANEKGTEEEKWIWKE